MLDASRLIADLYQVHQSCSSKLLLLETQCSSLNELIESKIQDFTEHTYSESLPNPRGKSPKTQPKSPASEVDKELQEVLSEAEALLAKARRLKQKYGIGTPKQQHTETKLPPKTTTQEEEKPAMDPVKQSFHNNFGNNFPEDFRIELSTYWNNIQEDMDEISTAEESFIAKVSSSVPEEEQNELVTVHRCVLNHCRAHQPSNMD